MRVLMTGGGTAGHVNPAIAIANTIREYEKDSEIAFVCSMQPRDKAQDLVPRAGYEKLYRVNIQQSHKIYDPRNLITLYSMIKSKGEAKRIIKEFAPDVIIGTGGFACYPVLNAGAEMGIPTLVHESNAIPGKAVLRLAPRIDCVMTNFESSAGQIKRAKEIVCVGNPAVVGQKSTDTAEIAKGYSKSVLIFGGSLGAETLNMAVCEMLEKIADKYPDTEFYHAAGKRDYEHLKSEFEKRGLLAKKNVVLVDYIYDMDSRMKRADLIISRAGAMTISELALMGKAAVLVPSPYVAANHQYKNAKALYDAKACELVQESEFRRLLPVVEELLTATEKRDGLARNVEAFAKPDANRIIYEKIKKVVAEKKNN
ncbi:MAG: UDP-N-acetylglucosamine--N-acetylmuramyl-(pentapeptide) pyrophosphoryl-undecaprenol N-acetylglucosamine transferase [Clostridia bacterium]|nr:UDP-N-acetylglucosamine--N-acetylmuramyl-(pentapeptide) pyrophosphoryl-undecaprenol N-acetylglucosamine transferase [Clostridia bacterium]